MHRFYRFACPKHWYSGHLFSFFLLFLSTLISSYSGDTLNILWRPIHPPFLVLETVVQAGLITPLALGLANPLILSFRSQCFAQEWAWAPIQSNKSQAHPGHFLKD